MIGCMIPGCPCPHAGAPARANDPAEVAAIVARGREPGVGSELRHQDKIAAALELTRRGYGAEKIGIALGVSKRTVCRWRAAARLTEVQA